MTPGVVGLTSTWGITEPWVRNVVPEILRLPAWSLNVMSL